MLAALLTATGFVAIWLANREVKNVESIDISVFREAPKTAISDAFITLTAEDDLVFVNFFLTRGEARRLIIALSHLDPSVNQNPIADGTCNAWEGADWHSFARKTDHALALTYLRESAWPLDSRANHVRWQSGHKPTLVEVKMS